jgi:flagellar motor protein MotB
MRHRTSAFSLMLALAVCFLLSGAVNAHEWDRDDSDYLPRYLAYVLHPVGKLMSYPLIWVHDKIHDPAHPRRPEWVGHEVRGGLMVSSVVSSDATIDATDNIIAAEEPNGKQALLDEIEKLRQSLAALEEERKKWGDNVGVAMTDRGLAITITGDVLFNSGSDQLTTEGLALLGKVSSVLKEKYPNNPLGLEGHTDNEPISTSGWKSNWELGAARGLSVLHFLTDEAKIPPERLSATSYGEIQPVASNATPETMAKNRRAVILVLPEKKKAEATPEATPEAK